MAGQLFYQYSHCLLPFQAQERAGSRSWAPPEQHVTQKRCAALLRSWAKTQSPTLALLGFGQGALAASLARELTGKARLLVLDLSPERIRHALEHRPGLLAWWTQDSGHQLLTDSSPWALALLPSLIMGDTFTNAMVVNPELPRSERAPYAQLQKMLQEAAPKTYAPSPKIPPPSISAACILHPNEPRLGGFFSQFPSWLKEVIVVWDGENLPEHSYRPAPPLKQSAHPLRKDFSAQRNRMLAKCSGDWVLYLDGDERPAPEFWELLPELCAAPDVKSYFFPRLTFIENEQTALAGMGLWPDLQLRLFRNHPDARFERPVHERLLGLHGGAGVLLNVSIRHYSHLFKNRDEITKKLEHYDLASQRRRSHCLNKEWPTLQHDFFHDFEYPAHPARGLCFDYNPIR